MLCKTAVFVFVLSFVFPHRVEKRSLGKPLHLSLITAEDGAQQKQQHFKLRPPHLIALFEQGFFLLQLMNPTTAIAQDVSSPTKSHESTYISQSVCPPSRHAYIPYYNWHFFTTHCEIWTHKWLALISLNTATKMSHLKKAPQHEDYF